MRPVSVLFALPTLGGGGAERVVVTLLRHLDRSRVRPTLAVLTDEGQIYRQSIPRDVEVIEMGCSRVRYAMPQLFKLIWTMRPDVVFSTLGYLNLAIGAMRPFLPRKTTFIARETTIVSRNIAGRPKGPLVRLGYRFFYRAFDRIVCQSAPMHEDLVASFGVPSNVITTIHNPIDMEQFATMAHAEPSVPIGDVKGIVELVACGRLEHEKGFDLAIEALALVQQRQVRLTIIGEGRLRQELVALAERRGVAPQVRFVGLQANPFAFFRRADAFLHTSRYEGSPNAVGEALGLGTPLIATPALGDLFPLVSALPSCSVASGHESRDIAEAINAWLQGGRHRVLAEEALRPYSADRISARYCDLLTHGLKQ